MIYQPKFSNEAFTNCYETYKIKAYKNIQSSAKTNTYEMIL